MLGVSTMGFEPFGRANVYELIHKVVRAEAKQMKTRRPCGPHRCQHRPAGRRGRAGRLTMEPYMREIAGGLSPPADIGDQASA